MLALIIASVSFELLMIQLFVSTFMFWVKGERRRKNKDGQGIPKFTFTVCLSLDMNDKHDTGRGKQEMFLLCVRKLVKTSGKGHTDDVPSRNFIVGTE